MIVVRRTLQERGLPAWNFMPGAPSIENRLVTTRLRVEEFTTGICMTFSPSCSTKVICGDFFGQGWCHALGTRGVALRGARGISLVTLVTLVTLMRQIHDDGGRRSIDRR